MILSISAIVFLWILCTIHFGTRRGILIPVYWFFSRLAARMVIPANRNWTENRKFIDRTALKAQGKLIPVSSVKDEYISLKTHRIPVRIYNPYPDRDLPILIYFHGGGWVYGSIETHDNVCRILAVQGKLEVLSVGYRLAPENPYPAAVEDAFSALQWVIGNHRKNEVDPHRIILGGDSAGGNLAAVIALKARDAGMKEVVGQLLIYPSLQVDNLDTDSYRLYQDMLFLKRSDIKKYVKLYLPNPEERRNPAVSPLYAESLKGLPPTFIMTAEFDILRSDGELYAEKLARSGVPVTCQYWPGSIHGFISITRRFYNPSRKALKAIAWFLRSLFYRTGKSSFHTSCRTTGYPGTGGNR